MTKNSKLADLLAEAVRCLTYDASIATGEISAAGYETVLKVGDEMYQLTLAVWLPEPDQGTERAQDEG